MIDLRRSFGNIEVKQIADLSQTLDNRKVGQIADLSQTHQIPELLPEKPMSALDYKFFYRRKLPHIQPPGETFFVTFRLKDSLPQEKLRQLRAEKRRIGYILAEISDQKTREKRAYLEQKRHFGKWDAALDRSNSGPHWLGDPQIAKLVGESIRYRDQKVYDLDAFCIMPNHVHMVYTPRKKDNGTYTTLSGIMHSLKLYTAGRANRLLNRTGIFWQHENYDHIVRNESEWQRIINYVLNNPVKAGLVNRWDEWGWSYCKYLT